MFTHINLISIQPGKFGEIFLTHITFFKQYGMCERHLHACVQLKAYCDLTHPPSPSTAIVKESGEIISLKTISDILTPKSIDEPSMQSVGTNVICTFWPETWIELCVII